MNDSLLEINASKDFSRESLLTDSSYNADFQILEEMGYDSIMIKKVYAFLKPQSIEQAINLMTEQEGIYYHNFFKDYKHKKKTCYICGKLPEYHTDYLPEELNEDINNELKSNNELLETKIQLSNYNGFICPICGDSFDLNSKDIIKYNKCEDTYCSHCWFSYLQSKIDEGFGNIKCMNFNCKENLNDEFIKSIIKDNNKLMEKYNKFSLKMEILNNKNKKFCPVKNCDSYGEKTSKNKYVICKKGHKFCFNCLKNWHGNEECEKKEEEDFKIWKQGKIIKQCPNCKMWTEKNEGCNHMTCAECKYQWCWLCNGKYSYGHYTSGKCNGLQFYKPKDEEDIIKVLQENEKNKNNNYQNRIYNYNNNNRWRNPNGNIMFKYFDRYNIDVNDPLRDFNDYSIWVKLLYVFFYFFLTFEFAGIGCMNYVDEIFLLPCISVLTFCFIIVVSFLFFFFQHIYICIFILIPGFFYFPWIKKIWTTWFVCIVLSSDLLI